MTLFGKKLSKEERDAKRVKLSIYFNWQYAVRRVQYSKRMLKVYIETLEKWHPKYPESSFMYELDVERETAHLASNEKQEAALRSHLSDADFEALEAVYGVSVRKSRRKKSVIFMVIFTLVVTPIMKALGLGSIDDFWIFMFVFLPVIVVVTQYFSPTLSRVKFAA
jgi:hypothetical protein